MVSMRRSFTPELPNGLTTWWGRALVLSAFLAWSVFFHTVAKSNPDLGKRIGWIYDLEDLAAFLGPAWSVLEDRTLSASRFAALRGLLLGFFLVALSPVAIVLVWHPSVARQYGYSPLVVVFAFVVGALFVFLPMGAKGGSCPPKMPAWLLGTPGRFALLSLLACVLLGWLFISMATIHPGKMGSLLRYVISVSVTLLTGGKLAVGTYWATLDDRATEQPWVAVLRGGCLTFTLFRIWYLLGGLEMNGLIPHFWGSYAARASGFSTAGIVLCGLAAVVFLVLPAPRRMES